MLECSLCTNFTNLQYIIYSITCEDEPHIVEFTSQIVLWEKQPFVLFSQTLDKQVMMTHLQNSYKKCLCSFKLNYISSSHLE